MNLNLCPCCDVSKPADSPPAVRCPSAFQLLRSPVLPRFFFPGRRPLTFNSSVYDGVYQYRKSHWMAAMFHLNTSWFWFGAKCLDLDRILMSDSVNTNNLANYRKKIKHGYKLESGLNYDRISEKRRRYRRFEINVLCKLARFSQIFSFSLISGIIC